MKTIEMIHAIGIEKARKAMDKLESEERERNFLIETISDYCDENIDEIFDIADALYISGLGYGEKPSLNKSHKFCTDGISHKFGFFVEDGKQLSNSLLKVIGVGIEGGGCSGEDFMVNRNGFFTINNGNISKAKAFIKDCEKFKEELKQWIEEEFRKVNS